VVAHNWEDSIVRRLRIVKTSSGGLALVALAIAACPGFAAESLTRSSCWTSTVDSGAKRTLCFAGEPRVKMKNHNRTSDDKGWSSCEWTGLYGQSDARVTIAFAPRSGKCSNGAASPQWSASCDFSDDVLACKGASIVDGKVYAVDLDFK
jgi:hypothetical protein